MATYKWTGAANNGDYNDPANWIQDDNATPLVGSPTNADDFIIDNGDTVTVTSPGGAALDLVVDNGTLGVDSVPLDIARSLLVGQSGGSTGVLDIVNTTVTTNTSGAAATDDYFGVRIGGDTGSGGGISVDGQFGAASLIANAPIAVGLSGSGLLAIVNGATVTAESDVDDAVNVSTVGLAEDGDGRIEVDGVGSSYTDGGLIVGDGGVGELDVTNGGTVSLGFKDDFNDLGLVVGNTLTGDGTVTVDGDGSTLTNTNAAMIVGSSGTGLLQVLDGGKVSEVATADFWQDGVVLGSEGTVQLPDFSFFTPNGELDVDGAGSRFENNTYMLVGKSGDGSLFVTNGGYAEASDGTGGWNDTALTVGYSGTGFATVEDADSLLSVSGNAHIAEFAQGDFDPFGESWGGELDIVGAGSRVEVSDELAIAVQGGGESAHSRGVVRVLGGTVTANDITVSGQISLFDDPNDLRNHFGGTGLLTFSEAPPPVILALANAPAGASIPSGGSGVAYAADTLAVRFDGTVDMTNIGTGEIIVGGTEADGTPGELKLNVGGTLIIANGVIKGGTLDLAGGTLTVTPNVPLDPPDLPELNQFGDQHSVLDGVTIVGDTLTIDTAVLTLANGTSRLANDTNQMLLDATDSVVDLRRDLDPPDFASGQPYELTQTINMHRTLLTVDAYSGDDGLTTNFIIQPVFLSFDDDNNPVYSQAIVEGSGEIIAEYNSDLGGFYSGRVNFVNNGAVSAYATGDSDADKTLSILTNTITNNGLFQATGAVLQIGNFEHPLDADHVFTNLTGGASSGDIYTLDAGTYVVNPGAEIAVTGTDDDGDSLKLQILSATMFLWGDSNGDNSLGSGRFTVNGDDIWNTLTTITPSTTSGQGELHLLFNNTAWAHTVEVAAGAWLAMEGSYFSSQFQSTDPVDPYGLVIDSGNPWTVGVDRPTGGYISGNGEIDSKILMSGFAESTSGAAASGLVFTQDVSGAGAYLIDAGSTMEFHRHLYADDGQNYIFFGSYLSGGGDNAEEDLKLRGEDLVNGIQATLVNFDDSDQIILTNVHATSVAYDAVTAGLLDVYDADNNIVATLQFDPTDSRFDGLDGDDVPFYVGRDGNGSSVIRIDTDSGNALPTVTFADPTAAVTEDASDPVRVETASISGSFSDDEASSHVISNGGDQTLGYLIPTVTTGAGPNTVDVRTGAVTTSVTDAGTIDLAYSVADSALDYLGEGETRQDTFNLEVFDGHGTSVQPITVTVTGANDAPVVGPVEVANDTFSLVGDAAISALAHPDGSTAADTYQLTPLDKGAAGAIWQSIDLSKDITVHARLFFGTFGADESKSSDGITFAFQNTGSSAIGNGGQDLGIANGPNPATDAVGVKFDTFPFNGSTNPGDDPPEPGVPFAQFFTGGAPNAGTGSSQLIPQPLNNGGWHDLVVNYDATTHALTYTLDGVVTDSMTENLATDFGTNNVFLGFTGSTGSAHSEQDVQIVSITNGTAASQTASFDENGPSILGDPSTHDTTFTVPFFDADLSDTGYTAAVTGAIAFGDVGPEYQPGGGKFFLDYLTPNGDPTKSAGSPWGSAGFTFSAPDSDFDYLGAGRTVTFSYRVEITDPFGATSGMNDAVVVTITGANDTPVASADSFDVVRDGTTNIAGVNGLLVNDSDPDLTDHLTTVLDSTTSHGILTLNPNGSFSYKAETGYTGPDQFSYHANDGTVDSNIVTVTLNVTDVLHGTDGNDYITGTAGAETMLGGKGNDTYLVNNVGDVVTEIAGEGNDTIQSRFNNYALGEGSNVENLTLLGVVVGRGNSDGNIITGTPGNNILLGLGGDDTLFGGAGSDSLDGGAGADSMIGGAGDDIYVVDNIGDQVVENPGEGSNDTVQTKINNYALGEGSNVENLTLIAVANGSGNSDGNVLTGTSGNNRLFGMGGADTLLGGAGNDSLDGGAGADSMVGGAGDDIYVVDNIGDQVVENPGEGSNDTIQTRLNNYALAEGSNVENLTLLGVVVGYGNSGDNRITGSLGNNILFGMGGSDTLDGGAGNDILDGGGGGNDTFAFGPSFGNDIVKHFQLDLDTVQLDHSVFSNASQLASAISSDANNNALFTANGGNTITFVGVTADQLKQHTNDFQIV